MAHSDEPSRKQKKKPTEPPVWMDETRDDGFAEYVAAVEPEIAIEHVRYVREFPYNPEYAGTDKDYLHILISAAFPRDSANLNEWRGFLDSYPSQALTADQNETKQNPDVQVRAHYLRHALTRLLQLVQAPEVMISDLQFILDCHKPRAADVLARAQEELCRTPQAGAREIARKLPKRKTKLGQEKTRDHSEISSNLKGGRLVRPRA